MINRCTALPSPLRRESQEFPTPICAALAWACRARPQGVTYRLELNFCTLPLRTVRARALGTVTQSRGIRLLLAAIPGMTPTAGL